MKTLTMDDRKDLEAMLDCLDNGRGVLTAGEIHEDIPTVHDVSHRPGTRLQTAGEVRHLGMGYFTAKTTNGEVNFDGGGAMRRSKSFSWCPFTGQIEDTGYCLVTVRIAVDQLLQEVEGMN